MSKITDTVTALAAPAAQELGLELYDVEYVREAGQWFLRVYIDKEGGVGIDDCEALSKALDPILDEKDPIPDSYVFEVSSAGLTRELKQPRHFERYLGSKVELRLYKPINGQKSFVGVLSAYRDGDITLRVNDKEIVFEKGQVAKANLSLD